MRSTRSFGLIVWRALMTAVLVIYIMKHLLNDSIKESRDGGHIAEA